MSTLCPVCHGTGDVGAPTSDDDPTCPECDGAGRLEVSMSDPQDDYEIPCPTCNPQGDGFSKTDLAWIEKAHVRNARFHSWTCDCPICDARNAAGEAAYDAKKESV